MSFDPERYAKWRASIPWTDQEIADQLIKDAVAIESGPENKGTFPRLLRFRAARVLKGHLSSWDVSRVADALVKVCWCGKKALYRTGYEGRCSDHRLQKSPREIARIARLMAYSDMVGEKTERANQRRLHDTAMRIRAVRAGRK